MAGADKLGTLPATVHAEVSRALFAAGSIIATDAQISITTGAVSGKNHVPSKPGEPPNADTHQLADGILVTQPESLRVEVQSTAPHALIEYDWGNVAARPYLRPARDRGEPEARELVRKAVNRALRKHFRK